MIGTTVIVGGVQYAYNEYVGTGEAVGMNLATKVGLSRALQLADRNESLGEGIGGLPGKSFQVVVNGNAINVTVVEPRPGEKYITAWYTRERWGPIAGSYRETVEVIKLSDNIRVYNVR